MSNKPKLKILGNPRQDNGVGFYRIHQPLYNLGSKSIAEVHEMPFTGEMKQTQISPNEVAPEADWAEIYFTTRPPSQRDLSYDLAVRDHGKCSYVVDLDDDIWHVNPDNPNYEAYQDPNLDIARWSTMGIEYADAVTVTTDYLKEVCSRYNQNVHVIPNAIDFNLWSHQVWLESKKKHKDIIRIGWAGASAHQRDLRILKRVVPRLKEEYGDKIRFVFQGHYPHTFAYDEFIPWVMVKDYAKTYAEAAFDIAIAPMEDNMYNRAKSNLRLIEAGSLKIPTVYSPVGPYIGFPGLHADSDEQWYQRLKQLIDSEGERKAWGKKAYDDIVKNYEVSLCSMKLLNMMKDLKKKDWLPKTQKAIQPSFEPKIQV
jgi:glycosyltransferase involved in cell wall biosynthesis